MSIRLENVSYTYMEDTPMAKSALDDVTLSISDGDFVGVIGHTGSGKSTLIQHFNGLLLPTSGKVFVDEVELIPKSPSLRAIRQKVGMVFQYPEHQLFGETISEDVGFGPRNAGLDDSIVMERVEEALELVGLDFSALKAHSPFDLSGGQKRRVAIAGVLAMRPAVLVLDEPTAGLDPEGSLEILDKISQLHAKGNMTVILVTHSMEDVARLANRVIVMSSGKIVDDGTPVEVFRNVVELQQLGLGVPQITELMHQLKGKGLDVRTDVLTIEQAEAELIRVLELRQNGNV